MHVFLFREFGLIAPIHAPKMGVFDPQMGDISLRPPKGTNGCRNTSYEPLSIKIALKMWPIGVAKNG